MNAMKMKLIEEILSHMDNSQGMDLKGLMDEAHKPKEGSPLEEALESPEEGAMEGDKPKGLSVEKVSILGKPDDDVASNEKDKTEHTFPGGGTLGTRIGYPGSPKPKPMPKTTAMADPSGEHEEMSDDELKELLNKYMG